MSAPTKPWLSNDAAQRVLAYSHYASPVVLLIVFLFTFVVHSILTANRYDRLKAPATQTGPGGKALPRTASPAAKRAMQQQVLDFSPRRKLIFLLLCVLLLLTLVGNAAIVLITTLSHRKENWWCGQSFVIYVVANFFIFSLVFISIIDSEPSPNIVHATTWAVSLVLEIVNFAAAIALYQSDHREPKAFDPHGGELRHGITPRESVELTVDLARILCILALLFFYCLFVYLRFRQTRQIKCAEEGSIDETTSLLTAGLSSANGHVNGKSTLRPKQQAEVETAGWVRPDKLPTKTWWEYVRGYSLFFPYLWPSDSLQLRFTVLVCLVLLGLGRICNVLVPMQAGKVTDLLAGENGVPQIPWLEISLYIVFRVLQGGSGIISSIRSTLWIPISQYTYRKLAVASFEHVHSLSLDFHLGKRTGEVLSALNKGYSINQFLEQVTFQVLPMLIDLAVAIVYLVIAFDIYYALIVTLVSLTYMYITIRLAQWRTDIRRDYANFGREEEAVKNDSMVSYETVKYFNAEKYEFERYRATITKLQKTEFIMYVSLNIMNVTQNLCFTIGLMASCFLAAFQISIGQLQVGKFVTLLTYMAQLQGPLNYFGTFYRSIQTSMINAERLLELFREQATVRDAPHAREIETCEGAVAFHDVKFAYDARRPALKGLDFICKPGTTTALVGESGGGKSTVFRLLFRFYDVESGSICLDGRNVQDLKIDSVRRQIGVVPQDTVLFNETIMYNLRYANESASDEAIYQACQAASIHEQILNFPDGYNSRVGERGLKLSGGEKQRIAIARTILKDPRIILLDEATAALDSETEHQIQVALDGLSRGRTTIVIAHRLSTITTADQILVLHHGVVAERGTHKELLALKGRYFYMWNRQIQAQQAAEDARTAEDRVRRLRLDDGEVNML